MIKNISHYRVITTFLAVIVLLMSGLFSSAVAFDFKSKTVKETPSIRTSIKLFASKSSLGNFKIIGSTLLADADNDGISDEQDLCPGTAPNTAVNNYGCPLSTGCNLTSNQVSFTATPNNPAVDQLNAFLLADSLGFIQEVSNTSSFSGLVMNKTYMVLSVSYKSDGSLINAISGKMIDEINANCFDLSNALLIKVCTQNLPPVISNANFPILTNTPNNTVIGSLSFSDPESLPVTLGILSGNGAGIFSVNNAGQVSVIDNTALLPNTTFTMVVEVTDDKGLKSQATVTIVTPPMNDADQDGVVDEVDLCPNTPSNTNVNQYGCPLTTACNLTSNQVIVTATPNNPAIDQLTTFLLTDSLGLIKEVSSTNSFSGLTMNKTYMILSVSYKNDGSLVNAIPGKKISEINASCFDLSNVLLVKACPQNLPPVISNANFPINANTPNNTVIGTLIFSDPENQPVTIAIISGNGAGIFSVNNAGQVSVINNTTLLPNTSYTFIVEITDDKGLKSQAIVTLVTPQANDADQDGVSDEDDLCPNTPVNTEVNEYGCPITIPCNLNSNQVSFTATPNNPSQAQVNLYLLCDSTGLIEEVSTTNSFSGMVTEKTYMIIALSYENDGSLSGANPGGLIKSISANCIDLSQAILVKACVPNLPPTIDDLTINVPMNTPSNTPIGTLVFNDPENEPVLISMISGNGSGIFAVDNNGIVSVLDSTLLTPNTTYSLTVQVEDGLGQIDTAVVTIITGNAVFKNGKIGDQAFFDYDGNGVRNGNEPPLIGVKVVLFKNGNKYDSTITDSSGIFLFQNLSKSIYQVYVNPASLPHAYGFTTAFSGSDSTIDSNLDTLGFSNDISIYQKIDGSDSVDLSVDFGITIGLWDPYGFIYCENSGEILKGGKVTITGPEGAVIYELADGSNGFYRFESNISGIYSLTYTHPDGYQMSTINLPVTDSPADPNILDGSIFDKDGIVNGIISLGSLANSDTTYLLNPDPSYNRYYINALVDIGIPWISENNLPINCKIGKIGGLAWNDSNNDGIEVTAENKMPNIMVYLWESDENGLPLVLLDSMISGVDGKYLFEDLKLGNYILQVKPESIPTGFIISPNMNVGNDMTDSDFKPNGLSDLISLNPANPTSSFNSLGLFKENPCQQFCIPISIRTIR